MKKCLKKMNLFGLSLLVLVLSISCDKKEESVELESSAVFAVAELKTSDEAEFISDEIASIAEDVYSVDEIQFVSKGFYKSDYLPDCVTITTVVADSTKEKTLDFGEGCELRNGTILSGIVYLSYSKDMEAATKTLHLSLENFTYNGVEVEGSAKIERERSNENGNPQSVMTAQFNGVWPDGDSASFSKNRTREWIEGYGSGFWGDNVFLITGNASYSGKIGNTLEKEIVTPLRREWSCRFIVSGVLEITRNGSTATLDFGDGSCDSIGVLTYPDGESEEIQLRRFLKK